jgi:Flp pilus assembly protein TadD
MKLPFAGRQSAEPHDDLKSPLAGDSLPKALVKIGVAIAVPGGLYALLALVIAPLIVRWMLRRAEAVRAKGDTETALAYLNWAARLARKSALVRARRAALHHERGDRAAARADIEQALKHNPDHPLALEVRRSLTAGQESP